MSTTTDRRSTPVHRVADRPRRRMLGLALAMIARPGDGKLGGCEYSQWRRR